MQAPLVFAGFPAGYCYPSSAAQLLADYTQQAHAEVPENVTGVAYGPTAPTGDTVQLYYSTVFNRMYEFSGGIWRARYDNDGMRNGWIITEDTEDEIRFWDNASGAAATAGAELHTGPFWKVNHDYDGRFILGPGNLPVMASTVAVSGVGGADGIVQQPEQLVHHRHFINLGPESGNSSYLTPEPSDQGTFKVNGAEQLRFYDLPSTEVGRTRIAGGNTDTPSVVEPMNIMPPYRAAFVVMRTARIWLTLTP